MSTKNEICNLALSRLGDRGTVESIDSPKNQAERAFAKWYDLTRKSVLRRNMPSFAIRREKWHLSDYVPPFGYGNAYRVSPECLKILGVGNVTNVINDYSVEGKYLFCDRCFKDGVEVRFISDVKNTDEFTPDFEELLSYELAANVCHELTQNVQMTQYLQQIVAIKRVELTGVDSQENRPVRINHSKFDRTGFTYRNLIGKK